jgi:ArsR family transcriptional regulator, arsenate/arsenite/antimonite-responsive transcriptional repressor
MHESASDTAGEMQLIEVDQERLTAMLKALSHPVRLEIVRSLSTAGEQQCIDLTHEVDLAQSTASEHLRVLKDAGLIEQCGPGPRAGYCLKRDALLWFKQAVIAL